MHYHLTQCGITEKDNYKSPTYTPLERLGGCRVNINAGMEKPTKFEHFLHVRIRTDQVLGSLEEAIQLHDVVDIRRSLPGEITSGEVSGNAWFKALPAAVGPFDVDIYYKLCTFKKTLITDELLISQPGRVEFAMGVKCTEEEKLFIIDIPVCSVCLASYRQWLKKPNSWSVYPDYSIAQND